jgi:hypothetical protein
LENFGEARNSAASGLLMPSLDEELVFNVNPGKEWESFPWQVLPDSLKGDPAKAQPIRSTPPANQFLTFHLHEPKTPCSRPREIGISWGKSRENVEAVCAVFS